MTCHELSTWALAGGGWAGGTGRGGIGDVVSGDSIIDLFRDTRGYPRAAGPNPRLHFGSAHTIFVG